MGPIIGIMNIQEVNFYLCTYVLLAEKLHYFDKSIFIQIGTDSFYHLWTAY